MTTTTTRPPKPPRMEVDADSIPAELHDLRRWVVWRWQWKEKAGKYDKPPKQLDGRDAKSNDASTWCSLGEALQADGFDGVGFVLTDSDYVGVDLDDCRDSATGVIHEPHASVIHTLDSYAEVSPSGRGVKLLVRGKLPPKCRKANHDDGFEVYDKQYFTLTGHRVPGTPATINERQRQVEWLIREFVEPKRHENNGHGNLDGVELTAEDKIATARSALAGLSASRANGYWDWLTIGMALHSVSDTLLGDWDAWSRGSDKWSDSACAAKWRTFSGNRVGLGTLIHFALQDGWTPPWATATTSTTSDTTSHQDENQRVDGVIANCQLVMGANGKRHIVPLDMATIIANAKQRTDDWPRRVGDVLFVHAGDDVAFLKSEAALFGYYHARCRVDWTRGSRYVTKSELFAELTRTATAFAAVEVLPHEPRLSGHYYTRDIAPGNGDHLRWLVERFAPATTIDHDLITASFITPGWGGPAGTRPAFCITSDHGRGVGKTTLAELVGLVWNGIMSFSHREDINKVKTRLLTPDAMTKRVALLDNVKSLKFSWQELEAMVTATNVGGHRLFHGDGTRPNMLTWFITLNGASLSTDMATRSIIIKLDRPTRSGSWSDDTRAFVEKHRTDIIGDVVGFLRSEAVTLERFSRWSTWERDVLARLPEPSDAQKVIEERQVGVDVDAEEAATIEGHFAEELTRLWYDAATDWVFIPSRIANQWYNAAQNDRLTTSQTTRLLKQMATEGRLTRIRESRRGDTGRGFMWTPTDVVETVAVDLLERIEKQRTRNGRL